MNINHASLLSLFLAHVAVWCPFDPSSYNDDAFSRAILRHLPPRNNNGESGERRKKFVGWQLDEERVSQAGREEEKR